MDEEKDQFLINELAGKARVSVRTIRYYIEQGLLPSPQMRGRYSLYDEDYLHRIKLIKLYQEAHLPLKEIGLQMETFSAEDVAKMLEKFELHDKQEQANTLRSIRETPHSASDYIENVMYMQNSLRSKEVHTASPIPQSPTTISMINQTQWQRIEFAPGVELHYQEGLSQKLNEKVQQFIRNARKLFAGFENVK